jgi:predicted DCC family thiol-disulfide oxidoreductase YuxK
MKQMAGMIFLSVGPWSSLRSVLAVPELRTAFVSSRLISSSSRASPASVELRAAAEFQTSKDDSIISLSSKDNDDPSAVARRVFATDKRPVILFDGVCNLCNGAVNLALDWDPKGKLRFSALQSNVGRALLTANGKNANDISSIVLVTQSGTYIKSDAILKITEALTPLRFLPMKPAAIVGRLVIPRFLRDIIYDGVANNRYDLLGKQDQCRFDADGEYEDRFVSEDLARKQ